MEFEKWIEDKYGIKSENVYMLSWTRDEFDSFAEPEQVKLMRNIYPMIDEIKREFDNEQRSSALAEQKDLLMEIANKTNLSIRYDANCPLCALNDKYVNAGIFFSNWGYYDIEKFFLAAGETFKFDAETISRHKKHIVATNENMLNRLKKVEEILKSVTDIGRLDANNLEILQGRINLLTTIINELEKGGMIWTEQYTELNRVLLQFIDVKNKIQAGEKITINGKLDPSDLLLELVGRSDLK